MVKLIVIARCIPEDVYLAHGDQLPAVVGKKFSVVVREPESWYIGRLAVEIQHRYEALYRRPLGQIKYLKDAEDDCDLDLELTVSDLLVNEGKALKDSSDQKRVVLVVVDQGRVVRQGSVVPDLTPIHYQPAIRPPVPKFPGVEKRLIEEPEQDKRPPKRRRLDQIEEDEGEEVIHSIEGTNGINGSARGRRSPSRFEVPGAHFLSALDTGNVDRAGAEIKRESPGPHFWANTTPATRDELELLPRRPENWQHQQRGSGPPASHLQRSLSGQESARQQQSATTTTPITPGATNQPRQSSSANAINTLNGLKSVSPALRQSLSSSASRIRATKKNVYDVPESDVDDSQMSPDSRAGRKPITPKLVKTPRSTDTRSAPKNAFRSTLLKKPATERGLSDMGNTNDESTLLPDGTEAMDDDLPKNRMQTSRSDESKNNISWQRDVFSKLGEAVSHEGYQEAMAPASNQNGSESDEESSRVEEESNSTSRESKSVTSGRQGRSKSGAVFTSRSSSVASSASGTSRSTSSRSTDKRLSYARDRRTTTENEDDETLDSPGVQLEETLRQSSPVPRKSTESRSRTSASKTASRDDVNKDLLASRNHDDNEDEEDVARSPDSVSDFEEAVQPTKATKRTKRRQSTKVALHNIQPSGRVSGSGETRCYTCWYKKNTCDNVRPKCASCAKNKKNCQIYDMTRKAADEEKQNRKLGITSAPRPGSRGSTVSNRKINEPHTSDEVVSASDRDDESELEEEDENEVESGVKAKVLNQNGNTTKKLSKTPSAALTEGACVTGLSRRKKKVDKRKSTGEQSEQSSDDAEMSGQDSQADQTDTARPTKQESMRTAPIGNARKSQADQRLGGPDTLAQKKPAQLAESEVSKKIVAVDRDAKCAVTLSTGQPCLRNLECKTHKVAEKKAVPGRSQPFDALLKQHKQRVKQPAKEQESSKISNTKQNTGGNAQQVIDKQEPRPSPETIRTPMVQERPVDSGFVQNHSVKASSADGRAPSSVRTIPSGMTEEEFDRLVRDRSALTEEERKNKNLASRKSLGPQKDTSPLVVRSQGSEDAVENTKRATSSIKSDDKVTSSSQASGKRRQAPASTQPEPNSHVFATATTPGPVNTIVPKSAPSKTSVARNAAADARLAGRLKQHPTVANSAAAVDAGKHANPPYRQPLRKSLLVNTASASSADLGTARSLKQLKETLRSSGSGASTPQPQSAKNRTAMLNSDIKPKKGFEMSDEEDDDESTESEEESPAKEEMRPKGLQSANSFTAVNGEVPGMVNGVANVIVRRREPTADDSDDSDDADW